MRYIDTSVSPATVGALYRVKLSVQTPIVIPVSNPDIKG